MRWYFGFELAKKSQSRKFDLLNELLSSFINGQVDIEMLDVLKELSRPNKGRIVSRIIRDSGKIPVLILLLNDDQLKVKSLETLTTILNINYDNEHEATRNFLQAKDAIPYILTMLQSADRNEKIVALGALSNFLWDSDSKQSLRSSGVIPILSNIIKDGVSSLRIDAAKRLTAVLYKTPEEDRQLVDDETVKCLGEMVACKSQCHEALLALYVINFINPRKILLSDGFLQNLVACLNDTTVCLQSIKVISTLVKDEEFKFEIVKFGTINCLVEFLNQEEDIKLKRFAAISLLSICENVPSFSVKVIGLGAETFLRKMKLSGVEEEDRKIAEDLLDILGCSTWKCNKSEVKTNRSSIPARLRNQSCGCGLVRSSKPPR